MKKQLILTAGLVLALSACGGASLQAGTAVPERFTISKATLMDKIKGGWAGQTIGCTYGGPTEFNYSGTMMQPYIPIEWPEGYIKWYFDNSPGLYDDIYMDLTFVDVFDRLGIDAPADSLAIAFANADYALWHANQSARYNILQGIMPPASGHWHNNPHADDIDFQIEADFAGLMSPGMVNSASEYSDRVGHIMNYGDGWYGGVYIAAMYALAFISDDIDFVTAQALRAIPEQSVYYQCMNDVIGWHRQFPDDWTRAWYECEKKWSSDIGCPDGVFRPFNIDAVINSAYVLIGLLYGEGDFYRTIDIATRCGADSDCNPASAAGILGTMIGYSNIPEYWMPNLRQVEDMNFAYTDISLNRTYQMSYDQALKVIERGGGTIEGDNVTIVCGQPRPVRYEKAFEGHYPVEVREFRVPIAEAGVFEFDGIGIVFKGGVRSDRQDYVALVEVWLDDKLAETAKLPALGRVRRNEIFWKYDLAPGRHRVTFKWLNPIPEATLTFRDAVIYADAPVTNFHQQ